MACGDAGGGGGKGDAGLDAATDAPSDAANDDASVLDESKEEEINVAAGGTLEIPGLVTFTVEPESIDTESETVTIAVHVTDPAETLAEYSTVIGPVYDFGPDGMQFSPPATLTIPRPAGHDGDNVVVSRYDDDNDAWVDLPTTVAENDLSVYVNHFTKFAPRVVETNECVFETCGGDLVDTAWDIDTQCLVEEFAAVWNVLEPWCAGASFQERIRILSGTITFSEDVMAMSTEEARDVRATVPTSCFEALTAEDCDDVDTRIHERLNWTGSSCTLNGGNCDCTGTYTMPGGSELEYSVADDTISVIVEEEVVGTGKFCVYGNNDSKLAMGSTYSILRASAQQ